MGHRLPRELLEELQTYLQHFDDTGHLGETETVAEIKRHLRVRIASRGRAQSQSPERKFFDSPPPPLKDYRRDRSHLRFRKRMTSFLYSHGTPETTIP